MPKKEMQLGDLVQDTITGFEGVAVGKTEWLWSCSRVAIQPKKLDKDGKPIEAQWFDIHQIKVIKRGVVKPEAIKKAKKDTGGPQADPSNHRSAPKR